MYDGRSTADIRASLAESLRSSDAFDEPALDDEDVLGALATAISDAAADIETSLEEISRDASLLTATGEALTRKAAARGVDRREPVAATGVLAFQRSSAATTDYTIPSGTRARTTDGAITFQTTQQATLSSGDTSVLVTAQATEGGTQGNLPPDKLVEMPAPPSGIESVTNPEPTGDPDYTDTNGQSLVAGLDREGDEALRERALESLSFGGASTPNAIESALRDVPSVRTVTVFSNPTNSTDDRGLPPYSNEVLVAGGTDTAIADALVNSVAVTDLLRLQGGVIGNGTSVTRSVSALEQDVTVNFARPIEVTLSIELTLDTTATYEGGDYVANRLVEYVGGTRTDGSNIIGLGANENVYVSQLRDAVLTDSGVRAIADMTIDTNGDGTDDRTTDTNGVELLSVAAEEQAFLDATNVTITEV